MAGLTVGSVVAGVLAALVVGATVRGWRLVWQVSGRWPDLRGDWTAEGSRDSGAVDVEEVHIDRQLGRRFRGKLTCVVNGAKLELDLRGRFYDLETLTYEHRYRAPGQASQIGVGLLQLSRLRDSATIERNHLAIGRSLQVMEHKLGENTWCMGTHFGMADIAIGSALGYLDFRFGDINWRIAQPNLARLYDKLMQRPSFNDTTPPVGM